VGGKRGTWEKGDCRRKRGGENKGIHKNEKGEKENRLPGRSIFSGDEPLASSHEI